MNVTKQHFVERRVMSKQELAHLYCPHSCSKGHAARDESMEWGYSIVDNKITLQVKFGGKIS